MGRLTDILQLLPPPLPIPPIADAIPVADSAVAPVDMAVVMSTTVPVAVVVEPISIVAIVTCLTARNRGGLGCPAGIGFLFKRFVTSLVPGRLCKVLWSPVVLLLVCVEVCKCHDD